MILQLQKLHWKHRNFTQINQFKGPKFILGLFFTFILWRPTDKKQKKTKKTLKKSKKIFLILKSVIYLYHQTITITNKTKQNENRKL